MFLPKFCDGNDVIVDDCSLKILSSGNHFGLVLIKKALYFWYSSV